MSGPRADEGDPSPEKKNGSARTSKKWKRRNLIPFEEWSAEQESVKSSPTGVQQQAQDLEHGAEAVPEFPKETLIPEAPAIVVDVPPKLSHEMKDVSPNTWTTAPEFPSPPDEQNEDAPPLELHSPTTSEHMDQDYDLAGEEQQADDCESENMRPNAQNLRYGGYPAQPAPQNRNTPLGSGRLQNTTKLGAAEFPSCCVVQWNADAF